MTEPAKCVSVVDAVNDTAVIAVRLVDRTILKSPKLIIDALQSKEGAKALEAALREIANERLKEAPVQFSAEDAQKFGQKLGSATLDGLKSGTLEQVKKSAEYQRLEKSAERLVQSLKCSPAGVWVDEHEALVYIVGAGLLLGGATALYVLRTGDVVTDPVMSLVKDKKVKIKARQNIEISAGVPRFVPSQRVFEVDAQAVAKWKSLEVKLDVTVQTANDKFTVAGSGQVLLPFHGGTVRIEGSHDSRNPKVAPIGLGLGVSVKPQGVRVDIYGRMLFSDTFQPAGGSLGVKVGPSRSFPMSLSGTVTVDKDKAMLLMTFDL